MKKFWIFQSLALIAIPYLLQVINARHYLRGWVLGWIIMMLSWLGYMALSRAFVQKKLIAPALMLIVFKYALLGIILIKVLKNSDIHPVHMMLGVVSFVIVSIMVFILEITPWGSESFKEEACHSHSHH